MCLCIMQLSCRLPKVKFDKLVWALNAIIKLIIIMIYSFFLPPFSFLFSSSVTTAKGLDNCFATNTFAPFVLTRLLGDLLRRNRNEVGKFIFILPFFICFYVFGFFSYLVCVRAQERSRVIYMWGGGFNHFNIDDLQSVQFPYKCVGI